MDQKSLLCPKSQQKTAWLNRKTFPKTVMWPLYFFVLTHAESKKPSDREVRLNANGHRIHQDQTSGRFAVERELINKVGQSKRVYVKDTEFEEMDSYIVFL